MRHVTRMAMLAGVAVAALAGSAAAADYTIGISNTVQGNGWREEMICAMKAQALASGKVKSLNIAHRNTDAAGQLEDIRNLIAAGVNAIAVMGKVIEAIGQIQEQRRSSPHRGQAKIFPDAPHDVLNFGTISGGIDRKSVV